MEDITWKTSARWDDFSKMNLKYVEWDGVDWIHLAEDRGPVSGSCERHNELRIP
jgi:hypothetical protein